MNNGYITGEHRRPLSIGLTEEKEEECTMSVHEELTVKERVMLRFIAWYLWRVGMGDIQPTWTSRVAEIVYTKVVGEPFLMKEWDGEDFADYFKWHREDQ